MYKFSSRRQSSDGRHSTFFHQEIAGMDLFRVLIKETIRRLPVMVQFMDLFSLLIKKTIMRLKVMVQVVDLFSVLIKQTITRLQGIHSSHQEYRVLIDQWEAGIWLCDRRANERRWIKKTKQKTYGHTDIATTKPSRPNWPIWWELVKSHYKEKEKNIGQFALQDYEFQTKHFFLGGGVTSDYLRCTPEVTPVPPIPQVPPIPKKNSFWKKNLGGGGMFQPTYRWA